jgi:uncharacterized pyridoxal phosphate-containing UPF0001 family protein
MKNKIREAVKAVTGAESISRIEIKTEDSRNWKNYNKQKTIMINVVIDVENQKLKPIKDCN